MRLLIGCFLIAISMSTKLCRGQPTDFPTYVGRDACLQCHGSNLRASSCTLEDIEEHDFAYKALSTPEAREIAVLCGEAGPAPQSRICLGCHATSADAGPRWTTASFDIGQGVQCEACHGAGSRHALEFQSTAITRVTLTPGLIQCGSRSVCNECHIDRPSHELVLRMGYRRAAADGNYKTPVNLVPSPDGKQLYVVCERANSVVVLDPISGSVLSEISVGLRPHDAALTADGRTLYVTNRLDASVSVINTESMRSTGRIAVGAEPHGVLIDTEGRRAFVLNTAGDSISVIDIATQTETHRLAAGVGPWSLALRPDGESICITNARPQHARFRDPSHSELTLISPKVGVVNDRRTVCDANMLHGIAYVPGSSMALFTLSRTKNLIPLTRLAQGWTVTNGLGILWPDGRVDQVLLDEPNSASADLMDIAISPSGKHALVSSGAADEIIVVDVSRLVNTITGASDQDRQEVLPNHLGMSSRFVVKRIPVPNNPRGIAFSADGQTAFVACALDDSIAVIRCDDFTLARVIRLPGPVDLSQLRLGERLFHSAKKTFGRQFSCRTCHPDGHTNGLTFDIEADGIGMNPSDNRTLRGILDTPPFKWEGINATLNRQCGPRLAVFFTRLDPFTPDELEAVVRYIATIERPPNPHRAPDGLTLSQRRGKAVFERTAANSGRPIPQEQRCSSCHNNPYKTARNKSVVGTTMWFDRPVDMDISDLHDVESFGELGIVYFRDSGGMMKEFDAPHLSNIYDSAPYLHNGASPTLEEIWTRFNIYQGHGFTSDLTRRQYNDLIAYLKAQ
mgnify:CR=1 FL=1